MLRITDIPATTLTAATCLVRAVVCCTVVVVVGCGDNREAADPSTLGAQPAINSPRVSLRDLSAVTLDGWRDRERRQISHLVRWSRGVANYELFINSASAMSQLFDTYLIIQMWSIPGGYLTDDGFVLFGDSSGEYEDAQRRLQQTGARYGVLCIAESDDGAIMLSQLGDSWPPAAITELDYLPIIDGMQIRYQRSREHIPQGGPLSMTGVRELLGVVESGVIAQVASFDSAFLVIVHVGDNRTGRHVEFGGVNVGHATSDSYGAMIRTVNQVFAEFAKKEGVSLQIVPPIRLNRCLYGLVPMWTF